MFAHEVEKMEELLQIYKVSRIRHELSREEWVDGEYQRLVPRMLIQLRSTRRLLSYLQYTLEHDQYPNEARYFDIELLKDFFDTHHKTWIEYKPTFSHVGNLVAQHLIQEADKFHVDRYKLRDGIWDEAEYFKFQSLESIMGTISLICKEELRDPYTYYFEETEPKEQDVVECSWINDPYLDDDITPDVTPSWKVEPPF